MASASLGHLLRKKISIRFSSTKIYEDGSSKGERVRALLFLKQHRHNTRALFNQSTATALISSRIMSHSYHFFVFGENI